jgi:hypothetical protein
MFRRKQSQEQGGLVVLLIERLDRWGWRVIDAAPIKAGAGTTTESMDASGDMGAGT